MPCKERKMVSRTTDVEAGKWVRFARRTSSPKLSWLERRLDEAGIAHRRNGHTWHAPILEVDVSDIDRAWDILGPVDSVPDSDERFVPCGSPPGLAGLMRDIFRSSEKDTPPPDAGTVADRYSDTPPMPKATTVLEEMANEQLGGTASERLAKRNAGLCDKHSVPCLWPDEDETTEDMPHKG